MVLAIQGLGRGRMRIDLIFTFFFFPYKMSSPRLEPVLLHLSAQAFNPYTKQWPNIIIGRKTFIQFIDSIAAKSL